MAAALAAAAVVVMGGVNVLLINSLNDQERRLEEQSRLVDLLASGSAKPTPMVAAERGPGASGQIFVARDARSAAIVMAGLPQPGRGVYQLWLLRDGRPIPLNSFRPDASGAAVVYVQVVLEPMGGMAVTLEDRPALPAPRGPAVLPTA